MVLSLLFDFIQKNGLEVGSRGSNVYQIYTEGDVDLYKANLFIYMLSHGINTLYIGDEEYLPEMEEYLETEIKNPKIKINDLYDTPLIKDIIIDPEGIVNCVRECSDYGDELNLIVIQGVDDSDLKGVREIASDLNDGEECFIVI